MRILVVEDERDKLYMISQDGKLYIAELFM